MFIRKIMKVEILTAKMKWGLEVKIAEYLMRFPVAGYGTTYSSIVFSEKTQLYESTVSRSNSCD